MRSPATLMATTTGSIVAPAYLSICILLGGSSPTGIVANAVVQLAGVPIIAVWLASGGPKRANPAAASLLWLVLSAAALILVELLPLPPALWQLLPGRAPVARGFALLGMPLPWLPLSLMVDGSIAALLALIPPTAMLLAVLGSSARGQRNAVFMLIALAATSVLLGILQEFGIIQHFYAFSSLGVTGFFSNRNHLATLCLMTLPFAAALGISGAGRVAIDRRISRRLIAGSVAALMAIGVLVVASIAGWMFLGPMAVGCLLLYQRGERGRVSRRTGWIAAATVALALAIAVAASFTVGDLSQQTSEVKPHQRQEFMRLTLAAARDHLPFGSGFGSFVTLYPRYESPAAIGNLQVNHAHNEYIELLLEGGVPALLLVAAFLSWWFRRSREAWRRESALGSFARAGSLAIAVPLAHSLVDYPARTAAIAAVAALAAGLLVGSPAEPRPISARRRARDSGMIVLTPGRALPIGGEAPQPG